MNNTIVSFHIGRGGRYNNPRILSFIGELNIQELLRLCDNSRKWTFWQDRDSKGKFCTPGYYDISGHLIISDKQIATGTGYLEWDTIHDTDYSIRLEDCDEKELQAILDYTGHVPYKILDYGREQLNTIEL